MGPPPLPDRLQVLLATRDARFSADVLARLEGLGLDVVQVDSPEALARAASARRRSLALVDARAEHGLEWCRAIPRNQELPLLPLIALIPGCDSALARTASRNWRVFVRPAAIGAALLCGARASNVSSAAFADVAMPASSCDNVGNFDSCPAANAASRASDVSMPSSGSASAAVTLGWLS